MKFLKYFTLFIIGIVALVFIVALFTPKDFHVKGITTIQQPVDEVYEYISHVSHQENFGVWFRMDKNIQIKKTGTDGTVGFEYEWKSEEVGDGKQVITGLIPNQQVDIDLYLMDSKTPSKSYFITEAIDSTSTQVTWGVDGTMPIPFNVMGLFYDMNKDFEQGVLNLKEVLEK